MPIGGDDPYPHVLQLKPPTFLLCQSIRAVILHRLLDCRRDLIIVLLEVGGNLSGPIL